MTVEDEEVLIFYKVDDVCVFVRIWVYVDVNLKFGL